LMITPRRAGKRCDIIVIAAHRRTATALR